MHPRNIGTFKVEGVYATHDASEGGLAADINERTEVSGVSFEVEMEYEVRFLLKQS